MIAPLSIWSLLAVFALLGLGLALLAARGNRGTAEDYYLGGRRIGGVVSGLSYAATTYSAFMLVVLTGLTYRGGVGALGFELIYFAGLGLLVIFAPRFWLVGRKWGFVTPAEMLARRYGSPALGRLVAGVGLVFLLPYCTTQMAGVGLLLSGVTGAEITLFQAVCAGAVLAVIWTLPAGLRSVAWTDAALAALMLISGLLAVYFAITAIGGVSDFMAQLGQERADWLSVPGPGLWSLPTFLALSVPWFFFALSNPQVAQRLFILRDIRAMRAMILWVLGFGLVFTFIAVIWGFAALILAPDLAQPALATPALLTSGAIPSVVAILLILGIMSAAVTTLDSIALTAGAMVARDLAAEAREGRQILIGRITVLVVILFAAGFAVVNAKIVEQLAALSAVGLLVTVPAMIGAFFWNRATAFGAMASIVIGAGVAVILVFGQGMSVFNPNLVLAVGGAAVLGFIAASLASRPKDSALDFKSAIADDLAQMRIW
ncbi:sodium:solute symporter family protein [Rhodobacteraceae bacterium XHP0102]|nr:sodium:solute symporter family protein [Rhodobacteraceae bacterium XHP0102]